jgi:LysR family hydrogen peroxide-inducible transcriptional activator
MRPTLRQLQYFVAVAEHGAFGIAAERLAVSQPSLSKQIAIMEEELGTRIFERTSRRVVLTPRGKLLLDRARNIVHNVNEFRSVAQDSIGLFGDQLAIGVLPSIGAYFMPIANRRLHQLYPDLRLVVREAATVQLLDLLRVGKIDAVVGTPNNSPEFQSVPLFAETLWVCAASDDPFSQSHSPVSVTDLKGRPLLALSPEFTLTDVVERLAVEADAYVSRDYQGASLDAVRQMAVMGAGVGVLPSLYALAEAIRDPEFIVRRIDHPLAFHKVALHWRRASPLAADFAQLAEKLIEVKQEIRKSRSDQFKN